MLWRAGLGWLWSKLLGPQTLVVLQLLRVRASQGASGGEVTLGGDRRFPIMTGALGQGSERDE